ncbi:hypothetical protein [Celeribacter indicus]|uniref:Antifreeze glycopeptide polyprotein n=1 Tax=Celeribacter indicus TaxID=1208324 RepID=A0A0B5E1R1_9RHOB|nr:hypothetical protein [Celeribacter indicus]AJE47345.1 hypothetical protein P73_2630 [Celeribacter indicus]SDW04088.1 hypothetical protein SAMN05443573_101188 [Celeribacter indicus]
MRPPSCLIPVLLTASLAAPLAGAGGARAQATEAALRSERPLSAIDWLSDTLDQPRRPPAAKPPLDSDISDNALPEEVTVIPLDMPGPDAAGLLPASATGLPRDLWGTSAAADLARRITAVSSRPDLLPASRRLLNTLILAELDPPIETDRDGRLFLARIDALLNQGLLDEADALMERAGLTTPEIFRRAFDTKLLLGTEDAACRKLSRTPGLSPTLQTRVFCLARGGDWGAAALTLESGEALGLIRPDQGALLARFLDPELFEGDPPLPVPDHPTPLSFRLMEAIGEPLPTAALPLAFAQSDLRDTVGWKARATAAERLARVGALSPNRWLGIWSEHLPAASGGIWDRIEALQRFETALSTNDPGAVSRALPPAWEAMRAAGLQTVFADLFAPRLARLPLSGEGARIAFDVAMLSPEYERIAKDWSGPLDDGQALRKAIALGEVPTPPRQSSPAARAIVLGFRSSGIPVRLSTLVEERRLGEAILRAVELLEGGAAGDLDELSDAIQFFRAVGLEATARRAALELLLLERRG